MIDFHCHLDLYPNPHHVARECAARGVYVLSVTTTPSAFYGTNRLARKRTRTALGLHPQLAHERKNELSLFDQLLPRARYVGEIGLDGAPEFRAYWKDQLEIFHHVLTACTQAGGRILSIHSRRATQAVLDSLERHPDAGIPILHWFSGTHRDLDRAVALGCWFSVGPAMMNGRSGRSLAERMPQNRILTESDGPFAKIEGRAVLPWEVEQAIPTLARLWDKEQHEVANMLLANFRGLVDQDPTGQPLDTSPAGA